MSDGDYSDEPEGIGSSRDVPLNELDLAMLTTNPTWGREATPELNDKLKELAASVKYDGDGKASIDSEHLWGLFSFYSRDMRLANLSGGDYTFCRLYLRFASDCLVLGYVKSFLVALSSVIGVLELSQSKGGFFRKRVNTLTTEHFRSDVEPKKRKLMAGGKNKQGGYV